VHDSVEEDEYVETINKLGANVRCLEQAEGKLSYPCTLVAKLMSRILCSTPIAKVKRVQICILS
jgi:hypothetical protein